MPTPLETFQDWEQGNSLTTVHIIQIDRGDLSSANRLTLTDKPYRDKGVSGAKYHDTYPAPIHCVVSDLVTNETLKGTYFKDIILTNGNGNFDSILSEANMLGHRFVVLRGDQSWSLLEPNYPSKFVEIYRGEIKSANFNTKGQVVLKNGPIKYKLDNVLASQDSPVVIGKCRNLPATLVDSATDKYRFNSILTGDDSVSSSAEIIKVRDRGVVLDDPDAGVPEYSHVLEGGVFKGQIQLVGGSPSGQLTADINHAGGAYEFKTIETIRRFLADNLFDSYPARTNSFSFVDAASAFVFNDDDTKFYYGTTGTAEEIQQYNLSTAGDLSTASDSGNALSYTAQSGDSCRALQFNAAGTILYLVLGASIYQYTLSTAWDLSTASYASLSFNAYTALSNTHAWSMIVTPDAGTLYLGTSYGRIYKFSITSGDISTATGKELLLMAPPYISTAYDIYGSVTFSSDGRKAYALSEYALMVYQYEVPDPYDLASAFLSGRSYFLHEGTSYLAGEDTPICFSMGVDGDQFYILYGSELIYEHSGISDYDLPCNLMNSNITDVKAIYELGVAYESETKIGLILKDLFSCLRSDYSIGKMGDIFGVALVDPSYTLGDYETLHNISYSDFVGDSGKHIKHSRSFPARETVTVYYNKNFSPQSHAELDASVSDDNRAAFAEYHKTASGTNSLTGYIDPEELIIDTFLTEQADAEGVRDDALSLWSENHEEWVLALNLRCISLLSDFRLGSIVGVGNDWRHSAFTANDQLLAVGRKTNWSKNKQDLTVFK